MPTIRDVYDLSKTSWHDHFLSYTYPIPLIRNHYSIFCDSCICTFTNFLNHFISPCLSVMSIMYHIQVVTQLNYLPLISLIHMSFLYIKIMFISLIYKNYKCHMLVQYHSCYIMSCILYHVNHVLSILLFECPI